MPLTLRQVEAQFRADKTKYDALIARGQDMTTDELNEALSLKSHLEGQAAQLQSARDTSALLEASKGFDELLGTTVNALPSGSGEGEAFRAGGAAPNTLAVHGAGTTWFKRNRDGSIDIESVGKGLYGEKTYSALMDTAYKQAFGNYIRRGLHALGATDLKALQEGIDSEGGYFVPPDYTLNLIQREPTPTNINPNVLKWQTRGDAKIFPKVPYSGATDDPNAVLYSTGVRVVYPGEVPINNSQIMVTEPETGEFRVDVHTAMMGIAMTKNLLEDSLISIMQWITSKFQETDDLELDNRILNGDGKGKASGVLRNPQSSATDPNEPQYLQTASAGKIVADDIKGFVYSLAPQYIANARWAFSWMNVASVIDKLKDGDGRYLWSSGVLNDGLTQPILDRRLLGFPVMYSEFGQSVASGNFPMVFGDWRGYYLVERLGLSLQVLDQTRAKQNQVEIIARRRFGGGVAENYRFKVLKVQ